MAGTARRTCYEGDVIQSYDFFLEHSGEHQAIIQSLQNILPGEFQRIGEGKSSLDLLGVGSGGGQLDVQMLSMLQETLPSVSVTVDIVEGSVGLTKSFRALVAEKPRLQKTPFMWHIMSSEEYQASVGAEGLHKTFDFINMIQMLYYVDDLEETIRFYHSLLKTNGRLMIIMETAGGGWDTLWNTFKEELRTESIPEYRSSREVLACLRRLGLKHDHHLVRNAFPVTECFRRGSAGGERLLGFMTARDSFQDAFAAETKTAILDLLRSGCGTEEGGEILFNSDLSCILVHA